MKHSAKSILLILSAISLTVSGQESKPVAAPTATNEVQTVTVYGEAEDEALIQNPFPP